MTTLPLGSSSALVALREQVEKMPDPIWKRVALPSGLFQKPTSDVIVTGSGLHEDKGYYPLEASKPMNLPIDDQTLNQLTSLGDFGQRGLGQKFGLFTLAHYNQGAFIYGKKGHKTTIEINHLLQEGGQTTAAYYMVLAEPGSEVEIIFDYASEGENGKVLGKNEVPTAQLYTQVALWAQAGSLVKIVNLQRLNDGAASFQSLFTQVDQGASVQVGDIQLGAGIKASSAVQRLAGAHADAKTYTLYYTAPNTQADFHYTLNQAGKKTTGHILSKGAMAEGSKKVFRGNLVFDRGATSSVGKEEEFVMLLNKKVNSDSIPGLFCQEDDVIGEHAASVGQIDPNKLFYLMSRGFTETAARKLMIRAAYEEVLLKIDAPQIASLVSQVLDRRLQAYEGTTYN